MKNNHAMDWFVLNFVPCPNCKSRLEARPVEREWKNVFCTNCDFACRFVVALNDPNESKLNILPKDLEGLLSDKVSLPPLIIDYKWNDGEIDWEKVYFFPFISFQFLKEQQEHPISLLPDREISVLFDIYNLPNMVLFEQPSEEDMAEIASRWEKVSTSYIQRRFRIGYSRSARIKDLAMGLRRKKRKRDP
jgi:hypothetical protein